MYKDAVRAKMTPRHALFFSLFLFILTSCSPNPLASATPIPSNTATNVTHIPAFTLTPTKEIVLMPVIEDVWINGIVVDSSDDIWLLAMGKTTGYETSILHYDGINLAIYTTPRELLCGGSDMVRLSNLVIDSRDTIWFSSGCRIFRFDGKTWTTYTHDDGIPKGFISTLAIDNAENLWIGTEAGDVSRFDGETWSTYDKDKGTNLDSVDDIFVLPDGTLWFGGIYGIARFDGESWTTYKKLDNHGLVTRARNLAVSKDGNIWVINSWGDSNISYFDGKNWTSVDGIPNYILTSILVEPNDNIWIGAIRRLLYFDGKGWIEIQNLSITTIAQTKDGTIWFGTQNGLYKYKHNE
jgi:ligand-binding sensor domain-containing protein